MIDLSCNFRTSFLPAALAVLISLLPSLALGQGRSETIVMSGQAAPDGNGTFSSVSNPALNNSGVVAFFGILTGTSGGSSDNTGIFRGGGGAISQIARKGQAPPDANGIFNGFTVPTLNNSGSVAFNGSLTGTSGGGTEWGVFRGQGGTLSQIARSGQAPPDGNGLYNGFGSPVLNDPGAVAFSATLGGTSGGALDDQGIYLDSGGTITQIARRGQAPPDANGTFSNLVLPKLNTSGDVAFTGTIVGTSGGFSDDTGIFRGNGGSLTQIAREGQVTPDGNGTFLNFNNVYVSPVLNDSGAIAFFSALTGTSGGSSDDSGIFRGSGGAITQIARKGQAAPDANGTFTGFSRPVLNNSGATAFSATLTGTSGGSSDNTGIFRGNGGAITQIARGGQASPNANGTFSSFGIPVLNDSGIAAFQGFLNGSTGGSSDNSGIFLGDGVELIQAVRKGQLVDGSAIILDPFLVTPLNNLGQVVISADLADGRRVIQTFTPDLHWRASFSSNWDSASRWTLGLNPAHVHDVYIDPAASLTVIGPAADASVRSLQIGGGTGLATLNLRNGAVLTATSGVKVANKGTLTGDGTIGGNVVNLSGGTILASNLTVTGTLTNQGTVRGSGQVDARVVNSAGGRIRALDGDQMRFGGLSFDNQGLVEIHNSELQVTARLTNRSGTGLISLQNGSLIADAGIINAGAMAMTAGLSNVQGDITNSGTLQVSGGAHVTFFDDLTQNGVMQVSTIGNTTSAAVLLGAFTGSGGFVGGGDVFALGDLRPGNSPDSVLYDGNLFLGSTTDTFIELGGLAIGQFDQMLVTGDLGLAGSLSVSLIDGHTLGLNQSYLIAEIEDLLSGQFNGLDEGELVGNFGGLDLFISYHAGNGNDIALFTAVPEPNTLMLGLITFLLIIARRRNRTRCQRFVTA